MKISLRWLNTYLDRDIDAQEAERLLTDAGFPIEGTEPVLGGSDLMLDVEVTSNRPDMLSHVGVAREIAARTGCTLKRPEGELPAASGDEITSLITVENQEQGLCPMYSARMIRGVKVGPSPDWLARALASIGQDSINNVADITNYVLMELGQPLHAFDYAKLAGPEIIVRKAVRGEKIAALNAETYELNGSHLVIADADRPVAIAGVMGGEVSKVTEQTADVLLEAARFDPVSVRRTVRDLKVKVKEKLGTESSFRYERIVDPTGVERASRRACELILEIAGGELVPGVIRQGIEDPAPAAVQLRPGRTCSILGVDLPAEAQAAHLNALGIETTVNGKTLRATIPSHRPDLLREVDLIEEVARQHGMDNIPLKDTIDIVAHHPQGSVQARRVMTEVLVAHGYHETVTSSLISLKDAQPFVLEGAEPASLTADIRRLDNTLRPAVLPSLLSCRKLNQDRGNKGVKLFELAAGWGKRGGKIGEGRQLAMLRDADDAQSAVSQLKGTVAELVHALGGDSAAEALVFEPIDDPWYSVAVLVKLGCEMAGSVGLLKPALTDHFALQTPVASALLCLESFAALYPPSHSAVALPNIPAIERDLSVVVDEQVPWAAIEDAIAGAKPDLLETTAFVGTYRGKQVGKGKKSVTLRMQFRDPERTLRHEQVDPQVASVVSALSEKVKAELRS
ncbi:phenylalanine--tRNA ligase subunit beta [Phycisphaeraceae bacterium D3-23]